MRSHIKSMGSLPLAVMYKRSGRLPGSLREKSGASGESLSDFLGQDDIDGHTGLRTIQEDLDKYLIYK
jgi:hypothetical protein